MTKFTEDLFDKICERISDGESLRKICRDDDMPSQTAVFKWLAAEGNDALVEQYTRAREAQADALFDDCLDIADQYETAEAASDSATDHIQRAKLRIDTRKWMAGKLRPKKYGEKLDVTSGGEKVQMPSQIILKAASADSDD